jgi:hypothetical protein
MTNIDMANNMLKVLKEEDKYDEFMALVMDGKTQEAQAMAEELLDRRRTEITEEDK